MDWSDIDLEGLKRIDHNAWSQAEPMIRRLVLATIPSDLTEHEAQEIASTVFDELLRKIHLVEHPTALPEFISSFLGFRIFDFIRKRNRTRSREVPHDENIGETETATTDWNHEVLDESKTAEWVLAELSLDDREFLLMLQELPANQVAEKLGCSSKQVYYRRDKLFKGIRSRLRKEGPWTTK